MAMSKQARSLVSTLVVAIVGGGVVWAGYFATKDAKEAEKEQVEAKAKAFEFDKAKVKKVVLTAKGETTTAEKIDDAWRITSPVQAPAEASAIDAIVDKLADLKARNLNANAKPKKAPEFVLAPAAKAADFGLDTPDFVAKVALEDGTEHELKVGEENPYDQSRPFLASGDENIYLADSGVKFPLDKSLFDLRDKAIVSFENSEIFSIEVNAPKGTWAAERGSDGWQLTKPLVDKADKATVDGVLSSLRAARVKAFAAETAPADLAPYGLDQPVGSVTFAVGADKAVRTLQFGESNAKAYARLVDGGPVMEVETTLLDNLSKETSDLRDRTVAPFDREAVTRLEVTTPEQSFAVTRTKEKKEEGGFEQEKFALVGSEAEKLKTWKLSSALYTLSTLKGQRIATDELTDLAAWGFDAPRATYTVLGEGGAELAKVLVGKETGGTRYYAMKAGSKRVYEVEKSTVDGLPKTKDELLETPPKAAGEPPAEAPAPTAEAGSGG